MVSVGLLKPSVLMQPQITVPWWDMTINSPLCWLWNKDFIGIDREVISHAELVKKHRFVTALFPEAGQVLSMPERNQIAPKFCALT